MVDTDCTIIEARMLMSTLYKIKNSRKNWKMKAIIRANDTRELRKENIRLKYNLQLQKEINSNIQAQLVAINRTKIARIVDHKSSLVHIALQLFLVAGLSSRAVARTLSILSAGLGIKKAPCHQTIINWVMRLTIVKMQSIPMIIVNKQRSFFNGFIWMIDISIGLGAGKILAVLALDAEHHRLSQSAPTLKNVHCVGVAVANSWAGADIANFLKKIIGIAGRPIAYLKDGGADLDKATRDLADIGLESPCIDDISHKIANLFKHEYEKNPMFALFLSACGKASKRLKQTILACLAPPKISMKARFMNLHRLVNWAEKILQHCVVGPKESGSLSEKLQLALGDLPECQEFIINFLRDAKPLMACQKIIKNNGLNQDTYAQCQQIIEVIPASSSIRIGFNTWATKHLCLSNTLKMSDIGLPVSTDQIESLFGRGKRHGTAEIKDANRIAMRLPAFCRTFTLDDAQKILKVTVKQQAELMSGTTLVKQRKQVLEHPGTLHTLANSSEIKQVELIPKSKNRENCHVTNCNIYKIDSFSGTSNNHIFPVHDPGSGVIL